MGGTSAFRATVLGGALDELGRVTAERDRLRAALVRYGVHLLDCGVMEAPREVQAGTWTMGARSLVPTCTCGLDAALAEPAAADGGSGG